MGSLGDHLLLPSQHTRELGVAGLFHPRISSIPATQTPLFKHIEGDRKWGRGLSDGAWGLGKGLAYIQMPTPPPTKGRSEAPNHGASVLSKSPWDM